MATQKVQKSKRHPDALKRARQSEKRNLRNRGVIARIKTLRKKVDAATTPEEKATALKAATSAIDKAARKKILHHRTAARVVSRITRRSAKK